MPPMEEDPERARGLGPSSDWELERDMMLAEFEEQRRVAWDLCGCVCGCLVTCAVATAVLMGVIFGLVAWVKWSWSHV